MADLFYTWGIALFFLLVVEKVTAFLTIADPARRVILFIAAIAAILWLLFVFFGLNIRL